MEDEIQVNPAKMEAMIKAFRDGAVKLDETRLQMQGIAQSMETDALKGLAGDAFVVAINEKLCRAINGLRSKFEELANDLQKTMEEFLGADKAAATDIRN